MKKTIITSAIALIITGSAFAQPVSDRAVIPLGVTLQQILRIAVTNGGNVEFVFNTIGDYNVGIANGGTGFYDSRVTVASSTDWELHMGAEDGNLIGTDNPANTLTLDNVGFLIDFVGGAHTVAATDHAMGAAYANSNVTANGLLQFTGVMATDGLLLEGAAGNGGDVTDNVININWECGTVVAGGTSPMNLVTLLVQSPAADRYVTNVFLDINAK